MPKRSLLGLVFGLFFGGVPGVKAEDWVRCDAQFGREPRGESAARCFYDVGTRNGSRDRAAELLEGYLARQPDLPWFNYYFGYMSEGEKAFQHLQQARDIFLQNEEQEAAFTAQLKLAWKFRYKPRTMDEELAKARRLLPPGAILSEARLEIFEAWALIGHGDLDDALKGLEAVEERVIPGAPDDVRADLFFGIGTAHYKLGQYREAGIFFERSADVSRAMGDRYRLAANLNMAATIDAVVLGEKGREEVIEKYRRAQEASVAIGRKDDVARAHLAIAKLVEDPALADEHLNACLALEAEIRTITTSLCLGERALRLSVESSGAARRDMDRALELTRQAEKDGRSWPAIYLSPYWVKVSWETLPRSEAVAECSAALGSIEKLRESYLDDITSALFFSVWAGSYHWLVGKLLEDAEATGQQAEVTDPQAEAERRASLELAFRISERYRARVLFERLQETNAWDVLPEDLQNNVSTPPVAGLEDMENTVAKDEALLVFQMADEKDSYGDFAGGAWLFAITRGRTEVYRLGDRSAIDQRVEDLLALEGGANIALTEHLYGDLLQEALLGLDDGIDKLLIVPDGTLHRLPFGTLGSRGQDPLAIRYQISLLPSANIWLQWRRGSAERVSGPALVLADPARPAPAMPADGDLDRETSAGERWCRRLPRAREEGEAISRHIGRSSELRLGEDASESFLKGVDLGRFGVIHLASHAFVDELRAENSLVCLAAGGLEEDGDLEIDEIVNLELDGQVVVLASCGSARGLHLAGEGVMSLARAFFLAGARTVVASLHDIEDGAARDLFVRFHEHLAAGRSVAAALQAAKREIYESLGPEAALANSAWAHVVVLGDGAHEPFAGDVISFLRRNWIFGLIAVILISYFISIGLRVWQQRR